ncbi:MAG TPA: dipeptide epimerase [Candidatus Kapabacteria bacterium]|nr:dipeptide epimerase [Candidatus Kapabacteria bacterium]
MKLFCTTYDLALHHPFNVSYARTPSGSAHVRTIVFAHIEQDGVTGTGEASPSKRYNETAETVQKFVYSLNASSLPSPEDKDTFLPAIGAHAAANTAAKCAVDMAWHDWWCKKNTISLGKYLAEEKLPLTGTNVTSFTIGIDELAVIEQKVREAEEYPILKIKLGTEYDEKIIETIRRVTNKVLRIDANEGWKTKEEALEKITWLKGQNVELIEQPLPADRDAEMPWLKERSPLPLFADESCGRLASIEGCAERFHGVNVKLMKSTGIAEAVKMIRRARELGMKIMMGCFIETSLAVTAAAHLARYCDYADLDGAALCENDPYSGATIARGKLIVPESAGIGAVLRV